MSRWVSQLMRQYDVSRVYADRAIEKGFRPSLDIQAEIDALHPDGGIIQLPPGVFEIAKPLEIGDGKPFCPSSRNGVTGAGVIGPNLFLPFDDTNGAAIPSYPGLYGITRNGIRFGGFGEAALLI